jgi:hypothetical protein
VQDSSYLELFGAGVVKHRWYDANYYPGNSTAYITGNDSNLSMMNGNVGIGTTSPLSLLHLHKAADPMILFTNSTTGSAFTDGTALYQDGNDFKIENGEAGNIIFNNNLGERMRINSAGNIGIGATSSQAKIRC